MVIIVNNGDNSKNKNDDVNTIIIIIVIIIINSLFQPGDFPVKSTTGLWTAASEVQKHCPFKK